MTDANKPKEFFCNGCGQIPCIGKCKELCPHGVMFRDFCDECHKKRIDDDAPTKFNWNKAKPNPYVGKIEQKSKEWDIKGAKQILDEYKLPSENIDIGNVYYAATQLEAALTGAEAEIARLSKSLAWWKNLPANGKELEEAEREIEMHKKLRSADCAYINQLCEERDALTKENAELKKYIPKENKRQRIAARKRAFKI